MGMRSWSEDANGNKCWGFCFYCSGNSYDLSVDISISFTWRLKWRTKQCLCVFILEALFTLKVSTIYYVDREFVLSNAPLMPLYIYNSLHDQTRWIKLLFVFSKTDPSIFSGIPVISTLQAYFHASLGFKRQEVRRL